MRYPRNTKDPKSVEARRDFLRTSALILGAATIAPWIKRDIYRQLWATVMPDAWGDEVPGQVDFVVEFATRASFPYCDMLPPPFFLRSDVHPDRGCNWEGSQLSALTLAGGRQLAFSPPSESWKPFAENIAYLESMLDGHRQHRATWALRLAGVQLQGTTLSAPGNEAAGPSLAALFADKVASKRGAQSALLPFLIRSGPAMDVNESIADLGKPKDITPGPASLQEKFQTRPATTQNSELKRILDAVREINSFQSDQRLKLRVTDINSCKTSSDQGLSLITTERVIDFAAEYSSLAAKFGASSDSADWAAARGQIRGDEIALDEALTGEALLQAYLGFKYNLVGAVSIHASLGHYHVDTLRNPGGGGGRGPRAVQNYIGPRWGAFFDACKNTPHPFRQGKSIFDCMLVLMSTDGGRGPLFRDYKDGELRPGYNWDEFSFRNSAVMVGGIIRGGYYGDVPMSVGGDFTRVDGFDFNSGATNPGSKPTAGSIYKTLALKAGIPAGDLQRYMRENYNDPIVPILTRT